MAEILSPNTKQRPSLLSPTSPFFLGSNDDQLERAQARAARAAAIRRKAAPASAAPAPPDPCLEKQQILELFQNCIKLASENKINQKNTWELGLIDHLRDIIKVEEEGDAETNFQKASCTLEAGVKIYSMRVDSVHSEAYKVLGGMNRVGHENEQDGMVDDGNDNNEQEEVQTKKEQEKKLSPLSTLESSFEALNVKKFDVAFAVDPLYHQTSAQFDEGGAKGLLLNNLGVYGGCRVLFDSLEVPGKCVTLESQNDIAETIDISFARESIAQMLNMPKKDKISSSLSDIVNRFGERTSEVFSFDQKEAKETAEACNIHTESDDFGASENCQDWSFDHDNETNVVDESSHHEAPVFHSQHEENDGFIFHNTDVEDRFETIDGFLFFSSGLNTKNNAWAGPDHWKYRKAKDDADRENRSPPLTKTENKNKIEHDLDFKKALENDMPDLFLPPKNPKSLLLPSNRVPSNTMLPEDCHYQPEDLVKLFLLPNFMCLRKKRRKIADGFNQPSEDHDLLPSWDNDNGFDGQFGDGDAFSDIEESNELVSQPRQVNKIEFNYDKTSKQVDVQALKETLWEHIQESNQIPVQEAVSFRQVLATLPNECRINASLKELTPHLCFICLLHLANEHGLSIYSCANLDDLNIHFKNAPGSMAI